MKTSLSQCIHEDSDASHMTGHLGRYRECVERMLVIQATHASQGAPGEGRWRLVGEATYHIASTTK
jgi:hypothetical protein